MSFLFVFLPPCLCRTFVLLSRLFVVVPFAAGREAKGKGKGKGKSTHQKANESNNNDRHHTTTTRVTHATISSISSYLAHSLPLPLFPSFSMAVGWNKPWPGLAAMMLLLSMALFVTSIASSTWIEKQTPGRQYHVGPFQVSRVCPRVCDADEANELIQVERRRYELSHSLVQHTPLFHTS